MEREREKEKREWKKHHYEKVAQWVKEVALVIFASMVIQHFLSGGSGVVVVVGVATSALLYAYAIHLILKS
jgi:hypothetical protein